MHARAPARASGAASPRAHHGALVRADQYRYAEARASRQLSGATLGAVTPPTSVGGGRSREVPGTRRGMAVVSSEHVAIGGHQVVIGGHQVVIGGHQDVIRNHQRSSGS